MPVTTIEWENGHIKMIDQTRLPLDLIHLEIHDIETLAEAIKALRVRGAPAIGIAGAFGALLGVQNLDDSDKSAFFDALEKTTTYLNATRPTAVNLSWALNRMKAAAHANRDKSVAGIKRILQQEALLGMAKAEESLIGVDGSIDQAIGYYQELAAKYSESFQGQAAKERAEALTQNKKQIESFYVKLNQQASKK